MQIKEIRIEAAEALDLISIQSLKSEIAFLQFGEEFLVSTVVNVQYNIDRD